MNVSQVLEEYATRRSDDAFKALVELYIGLVYSACFRQLKDRHRAEDATQAVFLLLSQKARTLRAEHVGGWLLTTSRYACANIRKSEQRRKRRELVVAMNPNTAAERDDGDLLDFLDEGLAHLKAVDREALVLRYLKEEPLGEIAATLGISEEAARKRISRGLEKLRDYLSQRGVSSTFGVLATVLSEQMRGAALPSAARQSVMQGVLHVCLEAPHGAAESVAIAKGVKSMMLLSKIKTMAAVAAILVGLGGGGWMLSRARADKASVAEASSAVPPAASKGPAAPAALTTQPAGVDLGTPQSALSSFFQALRAGDRETAYACLTANPNRPVTAMDGMLACNLAQNRLTQAAVKRFGDGTSVYRHVTLDSVAMLLGPAPAAAIDGDAAIITAHIPAELIAIAPENFREILRNWSGAMLYFKKQGALWKFDIDGSMRVDVQLSLKPNRKADIAMIMLDKARAYDQIAGAIREGKITTPAAAKAALEAALTKVEAKYGIVSMETNVVPAHTEAGAAPDGPTL